MTEKELPVILETSGEVTPDKRTERETLMSKSYVGLTEAADVLQFAHWFAYRWGRAITAYSLARGHDCNVYRARKILNQLVEEGLMTVSMHQHRENAFRRDYHVTEMGERYFELFGFRGANKPPLQFEIGA